MALIAAFVSAYAVSNARFAPGKIAIASCRNSTPSIRGMRWSARSKATVSLRTFNCFKRSSAPSGEGDSAGLTRQAYQPDSSGSVEGDTVQAWHERKSRRELRAAEGARDGRRDAATEAAPAEAERHRGRLHELVGGHGDTLRAANP